jgi:hypothetical protein
MDTLRESLGNVGKSVATATTGTTKLVSDVTSLAIKTAEQGVVITGKTLDVTQAIGEGALDATQKIGVATTEAVGDLGVATVKSTAKVGVSAAESTADLADATLRNAAKLGISATEATEKLGTAAFKNVADVGVSALEGTTQATKAVIGSTADIAEATAEATGKVVTTTAKETGDITSLAVESASKTLQAGVVAVSNLSERTLKGFDNVSRIVATAGQNIVARAETSQAATTAGIEARAPEKIRQVLLKEFENQVIKPMKQLVKVAGVTQYANLKYQTDVFKSVNCYGFSGFFKRYFSKYPCADKKQRPADTTGKHLQMMKALTDNSLLKLDALGKNFSVEFGGSTGELVADYNNAINNFRKGAVELTNNLKEKYSEYIDRYVDLNNKFFNSPAKNGGRKRRTRRNQHIRRKSRKIKRNA